MTISRRAFLGSTAALAGSAAVSASNLQAAQTQLPYDPERPGAGVKTKFAVNIEMWFRNQPFLERIATAARLGFPAVEFWPYENKDIDRIAALSKEHGVEVAQFTAWGFSPGMNDPRNHALLEKKILEACKVAKRLNCNKMTVVGGNDQEGMSQAEMHDNIIAGLKKVAPIAEEHEVMLILEPMNIRVDHKGHSLYGSEPTVRICREVNSPMVKINWDLYHMQISEGDLCGRLKEGFDQVGYIQLADHPGRNEPGTGEIHYNRVLREVYELGYRGFVGLECNPKAGDEKAALAVAQADVW